MRKLGRIARQRLRFYRSMATVFGDPQPARLIATTRKVTTSGGMISVRGHIRKGRAVHSYARRLSPSTRSAYRRAAKKLGRRLYRIETSALHPDMESVFKKSLGVMDMPATNSGQRQLHSGKVHWFTRKGWKRFGIPAYRSMYQSTGISTWEEWKPKIRTSRGGVLADPWQALK